MAQRAGGRLLRPILRLVALILPIALLLATATGAFAEDPATDFKKTCHGCHTIGGGRLQGPDLQNVHERRDRAWLVRFVTDPTAMLDSGDPYAMQLLKDANNQRMPNVAGMSKSRANGLLDLIEAESKLEKSRFVGLQIDMRPFTADDVALGRGYFVGTTPLANRGPACLGCHTTGGLSALGGGRLGVDLTHVYERYEDRRKLATWLSAPATATMLPTFSDHPLDESELLPLVAFLEDQMQYAEADTSPQMLAFVLLGLGVAVGVMLLFNWLWRGRFTAVRRPLVRETALRDQTSTVKSSSSVGARPDESGYA